MEYVVLPIVPLGVKAEARIDLPNSGAATADLKVAMPVNEKQFPIVVSFPEGNKTRVSRLRFCLCLIHGSAL
jgi:hypothetical protein